MKKNNLKSPSLKFVIDLAVNAGDILSKFEKKIDMLKIKVKEGQGVASEADLASEEYIVKEILKKFPNDCIVAEELYNNSVCYKESPTWVIDPLDGTNNYLNRIPYYGVCIAYVVKNIVELAVVYRPSSGEIFYAQKGKGSFYKKHHADTKSKKLFSPKNNKKLIDCVFSTNIYLNKDVKYDSMFLKKNSRAIRRMGSAALDQCYTALGTFDGFWDPKLFPWDLAASSLIASEAGCKVVNFNSNKFDFFSQSILIARPPLFNKIKQTFKL